MKIKTIVGRWLIRGKYWKVAILAIVFAMAIILINKGIKICRYNTSPEYRCSVDGHTWDEAICDKPKTCSVCGVIVGDPLGHEWTEATCEKPKTCQRCGATDGSVIVHQLNTYVGSDNVGRCDICGKQIAQSIGEWDKEKIKDYFKIILDKEQISCFDSYWDNFWGVTMYAISYPLSIKPTSRTDMHFFGRVKVKDAMKSHMKDFYFYIDDDGYGDTEATVYSSHYINDQEYDFNATYDSECWGDCYFYYEKELLPETYNSSGNDDNEVASYIMNQSHFYKLAGTWTNSSGTFLITIKNNGIMEVEDTNRESLFQFDSYFYTEKDEETIYLSSINENSGASGGIYQNGNMYYRYDGKILKMWSDEEEYTFTRLE